MITVEEIAKRSDPLLMRAIRETSERARQAKAPAEGRPQAERRPWTALPLRVLRRFRPGQGR